MIAFELDLIDKKTKLLLDEEISTVEKL